jgi:hypothetical protein
MLKSLTLCSALLLVLLMAPAVSAEEAQLPFLTESACASATPATPAEGEATEAPAQVENPIDGDQGALFLSVSCDACRDACALTAAACKAACGFNWSCIQQCNCDFYWCVDACVHCGPQDPPPAGC